MKYGFYVPTLHIILGRQSSAVSKLSGLSIRIQEIRWLVLVAHTHPRACTHTNVYVMVVVVVVGQIFVMHCFYFY